MCVRLRLIPSTCSHLDLAPGLTWACAQVRFGRCAVSLGAHLAHSPHPLPFADRRRPLFRPSQDTLPSNNLPTCSFVDAGACDGRIGGQGHGHGLTTGGRTGGRAGAGEVQVGGTGGAQEPEARAGGGCDDGSRRVERVDEAGPTTGRGGRPGAGHARALRLLAERELDLGCGLGSGRRRLGRRGGGWRRWRGSSSGRVGEAGRRRVSGRTSIQQDDQTGTESDARGARTNRSGGGRPRPRPPCRCPSARSRPAPTSG